MGPGMSNPICSQCGYGHPAIAPGSKCPLAKEKTKDGKVIEFDAFFASLKNVIASQIQKNDIKDTKKLFANILMEVIKYMEAYKEN
jgi:hypothetical protein